MRRLMKMHFGNHGQIVPGSATLATGFSTHSPHYQHTISTHSPHYLSVGNNQLELRLSRAGCLRLGGAVRVGFGLQPRQLKLEGGQAVRLRGVSDPDDRLGLVHPTAIAGVALLLQAFIPGQGRPIQVSS